MHHIQLKIIKNLSQKSPQRFTDLQPKIVPNNVFSYHLKKLLDTAYVKQNEDGLYVPTRKALKMLSYDTGDKRQTNSPLMLTMLYVEDQDGRVLLLNRKSQPFPGYYGLPSGLIHYSERVEDAARRELAEKTNIRSSRPLRYVGALDFSYLNNETSDVFVHAVAFVYAHLIPNDVVPELTDSSYIWSNLDHNKILPEVNAVKMMVMGGSSGITSLSFGEPTTD